MFEQVILVDEQDKVLGVLDKLEAHERGALHRALSIFIFDSQGRVLLQKRASSKYHSGGLWSNTCCSHPRPGEATIAAAHRRLAEEMGFDCELQERFSFIYRAEVGANLTEHEYDHVFTGRFDGPPRPSREEVEDWKWVGIDVLKEEIERHPESYTRWLELSIESLCHSLKQA